VQDDKTQKFIDSLHSLDEKADFQAILKLLEANAEAPKPEDPLKIMISYMESRFALRIASIHKEEDKKALQEEFDEWVGEMKADYGDTNAPDPAIMAQSEAYVREAMKDLGAKTWPTLEQMEAMSSKSIFLKQAEERMKAISEEFERNKARGTCIDENTPAELKAEIEAVEKRTGQKLYVLPKVFDGKEFKKVLDSRIAQLQNPNANDALISEIKNLALSPQLISHMETALRELSKPDPDSLKTYELLRDTYEFGEANGNKTDINWDDMGKNMDPAIVKAFRKAYESIQIPENIDMTAEMEKKTEEIFAPLVSELKNAESALNQVYDAYMKSAEELEWLIGKKYSMTLEDYLERYPEVRDEVDKQIERGEWYPEEMLKQ